MRMCIAGFAEDQPAPQRHGQEQTKFCCAISGKLCNDNLQVPIR